MSIILDPHRSSWLRFRLQCFSWGHLFLSLIVFILLVLNSIILMRYYLAVSLDRQYLCASKQIDDQFDVLNKELSELQKQCSLCEKNIEHIQSNDQVQRIISPDQLVAVMKRYNIIINDIEESFDQEYNLQVVGHAMFAQAYDFMTYLCTTRGATCRQLSFSAQPSKMLLLNIHFYIDQGII